MVHESHASPRSHRRLANQTRILDAAAAIVFEEGVEALSIKKVAEQAHYTPGALYRYFRSKDALLVAVVVRVITELEGDLAVAAGRHMDPLSQILAQAVAYREFAARQPHAFGLLSRLIAEPRVLIETQADALEIAAATTRAMQPLARAFETAMDRGILDRSDSREITVLLWSSLQGTLQLRKQERIAPGMIQTNRLCDRLMQVLLRGCGASEDALQTAETNLAQHTPASETESA